MKNFDLKIFSANDSCFFIKQEELFLPPREGACPISFVELTKLVKEQELQKFKCGEITLQTLKMTFSRLDSNILLFFGNFVDLNKITSSVISDFVFFLVHKGIKPITIKQYLGLLKRVLSYAVVRQFMQNLPIFPKVKGKSLPRASLSLDQYKKVVQTCNELSKLKITVDQFSHRNKANGLYLKDRPIPPEMIGLIRFMTNTFLRPVDIKLLQHKHIELIDGKECYLRINLPETKSHTGQVVSLRAAVGIYRLLKQRQEAKNYGKENDYVFFQKFKTVKKQYK